MKQQKTGINQTYQLINEIMQRTESFDGLEVHKDWEPWTEETYQTFKTTVSRTENYSIDNKYTKIYNAQQVTMRKETMGKTWNLLKKIQWMN